VEYRLLGPLEAVDAGRRISLGGARQQAVLAALLLQAGRTVALERLVDELWDDSSPETARKTIQVYVSRLRRLLPEGAIERRPGGYTLRLNGNRLDLREFEQLSEEGRAALASDDPDRAAELLREALNLWRGPALSGLASEAFHRQAERLEELRLQTLEDRVEADLACGRHREVVPELQALVSAQPFRERPRAQLMVALYRSGRQKAALDAYHETRRVLRNDLGLEPSQPLQALQQAILRQDKSLYESSPVVTSSPPSRPRRDEAAMPATGDAATRPDRGDASDAAARSRTNLPVQPTPFLGREKELREVLSLLRDTNTRVLTLTGAGGTGKTRLALQAAAEVEAEYPDGVIWVPLQDLQDPDLVESAISQALAASEDLASAPSAKRSLLVLDNFEQLMSAAQRIGGLCARLPDLQVLVTSREPLHLAAEREYAVPPLAEDEAVAFFCERARAVQADFAEDDDVREICRRLDCLPLAVELAAARAKGLSNQGLLRRLQKRLPLLTGGPRDAPERQRTLRATIDWSYDLLAPAEQHLFAGLAVFSGGCSLDAAEEVCAAGVDSIIALVDKSLLRREGDRYFMLETIREYAAERLEELDERDELRQRHAQYYLELARSVEDLIRSPQAASLLDRLERDYENLRAALAWLSSTTPDRALRLGVWGLVGRIHSFADIAFDAGNTLEAGRLYRESLDLGRHLGDNLQSAYSLAGLAAVYALQGRSGVAAQLWGCVRAFEEASSVRLQEQERSRYERLLSELEDAPDTSHQFIAGTSMTLAGGVHDALATIDVTPSREARMGR
jgi:predicted ATPase/DNA-binding SARP family transcriptional activator